MFDVGDQFVLAPNATFNDSECTNTSIPPRLTFQAHSAPLDTKFDRSFANLYVAFQYVEICLCFTFLLETKVLGNNRVVERSMFSKKTKFQLV